MSVSTTPQRTPKIIAWVIMLLVSMLPNIFWFELVNENTRWLFWTKMALLGRVGDYQSFLGSTEATAQVHPDSILHFCFGRS